MGEEHAPDGPLTVWGITPRAWGVCLVGLHVFLGLLLYDPTLFTGGDNAGYMILADALRSGAGYRDLYLPGVPLHTKYPPGYPVLLAVVGTVGGLQAFKLLSLACTSAAVWLSHRVARTRLEEHTAVLAAGLVAVSPVLLEYSHYELSEAPFLLAVMGALATYAVTEGRGPTRAGVPGAENEPADDEDAETGRSWLAGLGSAAAAFLIRTAGLPLVAAVWLYHLGQRQWRPLGISVVGAGAAVGGWTLYQKVAGGEGQGYLEQLIMRNPYDPAAGTVNPAEMLTRAAGNLWLYTSDVLPRSLLGEPLGSDPGTLAAVLGLVVTALAVSGWLDRATRRLGLPELFFPLYAALIIFWPEQWTDRRFLLPLLPLVLIYTAGGLEAAARRWEKVSHRAVGAAIALLVLPGLGAASVQIPDRIDCTTAYWRGEPCVPAAWTSFYDAARWAGEHTPEDAVVVNRKPRIFYWLSGRQGDVYPYSREPGVVLSELETMNADFVVVDQLFSTTAAYLVPVVQENPARFEAVYAEGRPRTFVLRFLRHPPAAAASDEKGPVVRGERP